MKLTKWISIVAVTLVTLAPAEGGRKATDVATQYQQKSAQMAEKAETANSAELRNAYMAMSRNYAQMSAMKREAEQRAARGQAMDWTEYHKLQGDNGVQEAVVARHHAQQGGAGMKPPQAPNIPHQKQNLPERVEKPAPRK